jgi:hypothetical protein
MARFYTTAVNGRGNTVGIGGMNRSAGEVHLRGWDAGVKVVPKGEKGKPDKFEIYMTTGSNATGHDVLIGTVTDTSDGPVFTLMTDNYETESESGADPNQKLYVNPDNYIA